jgi:DNA modification methylase
MTVSFSPMLDNVTPDDCVEVIKDLSLDSVDLILTDPPYLVNYQDRNERQGPQCTACSKAAARA